MMARQKLVLSVPTANKRDRTVIASRKKANEAANAGSPRPADGSLVLYDVE
jgi:hypothetical protein